MEEILIIFITSHHLHFKPTEYICTHFYALYITYDKGRTYDHVHNFFSKTSTLLYIFVNMAHETMEEPMTTRTNFLYRLLLHDIFTPKFDDFYIFLFQLLTTWHAHKFIPKKLKQLQQQFPHHNLIISLKISFPEKLIHSIFLY